MLMRRLFAPAAAAALAAIATPAVAGEDFRLRFPQILTLSPHGVNLQTGRFEWSQREFSIGPLTLDWRYSSGDGAPGVVFPGEAGSNVTPGASGVGRSLRGWFTYLGLTSFNGVAFNVADLHIGDQNPRFNIVTSTNPTTYTPWNNEAYAWTLVAGSSNSLIATYKNGDVYTLVKHNAIALPLRVLSSVVYADGHRLDYTYGSKAELRTIFSNRGYALIFDYNSSARTVTACGYNRAVTYVTTSSTCAAAPVKTIYTYTAGQPARLVSMTNAEGSVSSITLTANVPTCITFYGSATCRLSLSYGIQPGDPSTNTAADQVRKLITANSNEWIFFYRQPPDPIDAPPVDPGEIRYTEGNMYDPQGNLTNARYGNGIVETITSPAGVLNYEFNGLCPQKVTYPEGNATRVTMNVDCSITKIEMFPKPGSPQTTQTEVEYTYEPVGPPTYQCPYSTKVCDKPKSKKDGKGNETTFTWSTANGLILTETAPAVLDQNDNQIAAQTRYAYAPRFALIKNSSGGFVQAPSAVWVLTEKSICKTGNPNGSGGCLIAGDEVKTTYDYGPTSGAANNLLLRSVVEDAGSGKLNLRTCYVYDAQGNKIAETKPRGATGGCP